MSLFPTHYISTGRRTLTVCEHLEDEGPTYYSLTGDAVAFVDDDGLVYSTLQDAPVSLFEA